MNSCSDEVCHRTDEGIARYHRGRRTENRRLLRIIQQTSLLGKPPSVSGATTSQIPSNQLFLFNGESRHNSLK
ncbi:unnamed protein product [Protopolystoma xenopodis]|uniref:Uncharacterized protein n=1 Tax=Protopolystoma xenopodis TaxID=117903 RepID=A0A448X3F9_9PLAT|nr:unnamed protein product [Protopolystoma xenopodis]